MYTKSLLLPVVVVASLLVAPALHAQTYFYVDQISVAPLTPTDQDAVQLQLVGNLSSTGSSITSATASVNGFNVTLLVTAQSTGGLDVLVPHSEPIDLGVLASGTYTVTISGSGVNDEAPAAQHGFNVTGSGATACDSLIIASVSWAPFSDTALLVHVFNPTTTLFDYPSFVLLADNGDTLAKETVNFFGIAQESWHLLTIHPGAIIPDGLFDGTLQLWSQFYQQLGCSWARSFNLCPTGPCMPLTPMISSTGGALALGTFHYIIRSGGNPVATGSFTLTADTQFASDSLCLPPGNYLMEMTADQAPGGQVRFGVDLNGTIHGPTAPLVVTTLSAVAFDFYQSCADASLQIPEIAAAQLIILRNGNGISVSCTDGHALGELVVFDAQGRPVMRTTEPTPGHTLNTAQWAAGLYVVRATNAGRQLLTARWVKD